MEKSKLTVDLAESFLASCASRGLSRQTTTWYGTYLRSFGRLYPSLPMEPVAIEAFIGSYRGDERRHGAYRTLRTFYNFLENRFELPNPVNKIKPPRRTQKEKSIPSLEDLKKILEYSGRKKYIRAALYVLADTGARIGEIHSLESGDIGQASIRVRGKTGERIIPVSPQVLKMLRELGPGRLFPHTVWTFDKEVARAIREAGFPELTPHSLRHAFASHWNGSDMSLKTIGGWHSWAMVEHYSHRKLEKAMEEHATQGPLAKLYGSQDKPAAVPVLAAGDPLSPSGYLSTHMVFDTNMARNLFYLHALLANIGKNLSSIFEDYCRHAILRKFCSGSIVQDALKLNDMQMVDGQLEMPADIEIEEGIKGFAKDIEAEASALWCSMSMLIKPFIADHESQALFFRELCYEDTPVEDVQFSDLAMVWEGVKPGKC